MQNDITLHKEKNTIFLMEVTSKDKLPKEIEADGILVNTNGNEKEARRIIDVLRGKKIKIAVRAYDNVFNRRVLETMKIDYLVGIEEEVKRDTVKQRDSGLNHVLATIAQNNNIAIVIDYGGVMNLGSKERAINLSRIIQNIKICRRAKCDIKIASFAMNKEKFISKKDRQVFLYTLGVSSEQAKKAVEF